MKFYFCFLLLLSQILLATSPKKLCESIRQPAKSSSESLKTAYWVERLLCQQSVEGLSNTQIKKILADRLFSREILVLEILLPRLSSAEGPEGLAKKAKYIETLEFSSLEQERRQSLAESLVFLIRHSDLKNNLVEKLYSELPDTDISKNYFEKNKLEFKKLKKDAKLDLTRLKYLTKNHDNKDVIKESRAYLKKNKSCEAQYYLLKALRKDRQYAPASEQANKIVNTCGEPWKRKAFYFAGLLQNIRPNKNSNYIYDLFLKKYKSHSYADDMLYWKARVVLEFEGKKKYFEVLDKLIEEYPDGDYFFQAGFELAVNSAEKGEERKSQKYLERLKASKRLSLIQLDQIDYWQARLKVYPKPNFLVRTKHKSKFEAGIRGLKKLIQNSPTSYYSMLARQNLRDLKIDFKNNKLYNQNNNKYKKSSKILANHKPSAALEALAKNKYFQVAKLVLDARYKKVKKNSDWLKLAADYGYIGRHDKSHLIMRKLGLAQLAGTPNFSEKSLWSLGFPRLFEKEILKNTNHKKISPNLLEGLIREESQFYAPSISWAGAMGLCQFMPGTGADVARRLGVGRIEDRDLLDPLLSLKLGAHHLNELISRVSHPFLGIGSYNAGVRNIRKTKERFFKNQKEIPVDIFVEKIAIKQTRDYVKRVSSSWGMYAFLDQVLDKINFDLAIIQK